MKTTYVIWDGSSMKLMTDSIIEVRAFFKNLPKEERDTDWGARVYIYDEDRYEVTYWMDWEPYILDKQTDELICEERDMYRDRLTLLPLDAHEFLCLNKRYYEQELSKNK